MSKEVIVLALGGNAFIKKSRTFASQYSVINESTKQIAKLAKEGYKIVITHGNGPQVGDALLRNERTKDLVPPLPLYACVAGTQGVLGSMIQSALMNNLGKDYKIANIVTKVTVSAKDPSFKNPTKPIGPIFTKEEMHKIKKIETSASFKEIQHGKFIRVVPSPEPISILEIEAIKKLVRDDYIVIACGGGGIPMISGKKSSFINAVIDKDLASQVLATAINASKFVSLTNVAGVYINFASKNRKLLRKISVDKMEEMIDNRFFEQGSMEPKARAAMRFAKNTRKIAVIASLEKTRSAVYLKSGTIVCN